MRFACAKPHQRLHSLVSWSAVAASTGDAGCDTMAAAIDCVSSRHRSLTIGVVEANTWAHTGPSTDSC